MVIILSILLAAAVAFIFCLAIVLKKTFNILDSFLNGFEEDIAYNGKYYPAIVIAKAVFNSKEIKTVVDFSMYEEKKIVGFTMYTKDNCANKEVFENPIMFKNAIVYEISEGVWTWKSL